MSTVIHTSFTNLKKKYREEFFSGKDIEKMSVEEIDAGLLTAEERALDDLVRVSRQATIQGVQRKLDEGVPFEMALAEMAEF